MELTPEAIAAIKDFQKLVVGLCGQNPDYREIIARALGEKDEAAATPVSADERGPIPMVDYGDDVLTGDDIFNILEMLKVERRMLLKGKAITLDDLRNLRTLLTSQFHDVLIEPGFALDTLVYIAVSPTNRTQAEERAFYDMVYDDIRASGSVEYEVNLLCAGIRRDPGYRLSWIANLAQSFVMAGMEHYAAQQGAANFLECFANCDARKDEHFQHPPKPTATEKADRRVFKIELDKDDPAPHETIMSVLEQLKGKNVAKPRIRMRDGLIVYVMEEDNAEIVVVQVPAQ